MPEDTAMKVKVDRMEKDIEKLQNISDGRADKINIMDKSLDVSKVYQEQIMANLASITSSIAITLSKINNVQSTSHDLKLVTDKQTVDIKAIGDKVDIIEKLPLQTSRRFNWLVVTTIVVNLAGFVGWVFKTYILK